MEKEKVQEIINAAFPILPIPKPRAVLSPLASQDRSGAERLRREIAGKSWQSLPSEFLIARWSSFCYLSPEAYCYYMPALLRASLNSPVFAAIYGGLNLKFEQKPMLPNSRNSQSVLSTEKIRFHWEVGVLALLGLHPYLVWQAGCTGLSYNFFTQVALMPLVPIAVFSLLVGENAKAQGVDKRFVRLLLGLLVSVTAFYLFSPFLLFLGDCGARKRIAQVSDERRLQEWAEDLFQRPRSQLRVKDHFGSVYILDPGALPPFVSSIPTSRGGYEYTLVEEEHGACYLTIAIRQGRPHSWGVLLCPRNRKPPLLQDKWLHQWQAGVYGWQDQNESS